MNKPEHKPDDEINLLDYLSVVIDHRRMIGRNTLFAGLLALLVSFVLPSTYTATTTLLPPDEGKSQSLTSLLANSDASFLNLSGLGTTSSEIFVEILSSRTVGELVLNTTYDFAGKQQNLFQIWDEDGRQDALTTLHKKASLSANDQGVIEISVEMRDPDLAAQVARAFVAALDKVNQEKSLSKAKSSRVYIEEQLALTEANLARASQQLATFQSESKAVNLEEQTRVAIEKAGEIKGTIIGREVELEVAKQTMKADNPVILRLQKELYELRKQFEHLQFGNSVPFEEQRDYFIPFAKVPEVGLKFASLIREVKVQETVWQLLNQQYYSAKIQEARDTPTVQVLDVALPPEKRTSPKRKLLVLVALFLGFSFSVFASFLIEYANNVRANEADFEKIQHFGGELKRDYHEFRERIEKYFAKPGKK